MMSEAFFASLRQSCGADALALDPATLEQARHDVHESGGAPIAVLSPPDAAALGQAVAVITGQGLAVVPRGGGLSYTGGYVLPDGGAVLIDLSRMSRVLNIDAESMTVTVEAGATWKAIDTALAAQGFRLPFFGTFSGAGATVGGGLSHGALFFGSARYGSAADIVLSMDVVLADGRLMRTGQGSLKKARHPVFRGLGPDLTGLFLHDGGAFGIKTAATLRIIERPSCTDYASFAFASLDDAVRAMCAIQRKGLVEDAYIMDPGATDHLDINPAMALRSARSVARSAGGPLRALKALFTMGRGGLGPIPKGYFSLHLVAAARTYEAVRHDLSCCQSIAAGYGAIEVAPTIPMVARADPFPGLNGVLGPGGGRWAALNAKVALGEASGLVAAFEAMISGMADEMAAAGVHVTRLASALATPSFSFEAVFHWRDTWLPLHRSAPDASYRATLQEPPHNPAGFAMVNRLRAMTVELFRNLGAASNQIGRTYPFISALREEPADLLLAVKSALDPRNLMNPGVLDFPHISLSTNEQDHAR